MLYLFSMTSSYINFMQSGMYIDYIIKKLNEMLVRNVLIYSSVFLGEKFIIEFISKKTIDSVTTYFSVTLLNKGYSHSDLFDNLVSFLLTTVVLVEF